MPSPMCAKHSQPNARKQYDKVKTVLDLNISRNYFQKVCCEPLFSNETLHGIATRKSSTDEMLVLVQGFEALSTDCSKVHSGT